MGTVHAVPENDSPVTQCCGRTPFELSPQSRMANDPALVTCSGQAAAAISPSAGQDMFDELGNYHGKVGTPAEHRTVGDHRAWCLECIQWCYPSSPCGETRCCAAPPALSAVLAEVAAEVAKGEAATPGWPWRDFHVAEAARHILAVQAIDRRAGDGQ